MQEEIRCPYCELKKMARQKMTFKATNLKLGTCLECGAKLDVGQGEVDVKSLIDTYKGACELIDYVVGWFNELLKEENIELTNYLPNDEEGAKLNLSTDFIIEELFAPYWSPTRLKNFKKALEIQKDFLTWKISKSEAREEW